MKFAQFQDAFDAHLGTNRPNFDGHGYRSEIEALIQTIIPPKPYLEKVKNDLIRRQGWTRILQERSNLKEFQMVNENKRDDG